MPFIVAAGSQNPVKLRAVRAGFSDMLGPIKVTGVEAASGVPAQPMGDDETIRGAINRARAALAALPNAEFGVGLEGGVVEIGGALYCCAWCAIVNRTAAQIGLASTGRCELPTHVAELIRGGMELGQASEIVFARTHTNRGQGAVGLLTRGRIDRASFYAPAVTMALVRFFNVGLFAGQPPRRLE
jgi:inosine/xanthosine triphosphatase